MVHFHKLSAAQYINSSCRVGYSPLSHKINSEKSKEIIISFSHGKLGNKVPDIPIEGKIVERVDHVKLLGTTLSNDLTWKKHVDNIVKKAGKRIYMR